MTRAREGYGVHYDSRLVEDAVMLAEARLGSLLRLRFRRERDRVYHMEDPEEREQAFSRLHHRWFERMELAAPVARAIDDHPGLRTSTRRCLVLPARTAADEAADLRAETPWNRPATSGNGEGKAPSPSVVIQVRATTIVDREAFRRFLDHEFIHLADMLDPAFEYEPELPVLEGGPARLRQVQERYRALWDCTIDGRLRRGGKAPPGVAEQRRREFEVSFPEMGPKADREFRRWFDGPRPSHAEILRAACSGAPATRSAICPLCKFPYAALRGDLDRQPGDVIEQIRVEFPDWKPEDGICTPCLDLYQARRAV